MIRVLYFGWVREGIGAGEEVADAAPGLTVGALLDALEARSPAHREALRVRDRLRFAVDQAIVGADAPVADSAEVAIFPPVTGG